MEIAEEIKMCPETGARRLIAEYGDRLYDVAFRLCQDENVAGDLLNRTLFNHNMLNIASMFFATGTIYACQ